MEASSVNIVDRGSLNRTGANFRLSRRGPEQRLVDWFIRELPFDVPRNCRGTLFREPRLDSGFPDVVLVVWHPATMQQWSADRAKLKTGDLRLLHYLLESGPTSEADLKRVFHRGLVSSLSRLREADVARHTRDRWVIRPIAKSFAVRNIIAVEAKVADWRRAARQAHLNTWFTTESYVLLPDAGKDHPLLATARALGIGVVSQIQGLVRRPRSKGSLPRSYASWLFNEWVWRASRKGKRSQ